MASICDIPEVAGIHSSQGVVRIPPELDVPLTGRVTRLLDAAAMRRLAGIPQLGLVKLVYPGATHSRLEHSLGVYRNALLFLNRLADDDRFASLVTPEKSETAIVASLLHDVGHWPFCHPIEDLQIEDVPTHEALARRFVEQDEIAQALDQDWQLAPDDVLRLLSKEAVAPEDRILKSILSGPIDVDKMDYLMRDSLHAGVPYGRNFDQTRLTQSLCLNESGDGIAITEKGKTAAEMMVFSRYVMFSEVYWHHAVRSATAMLQRAFFELRHRLDFDAALASSETEFLQCLNDAGRDAPAAELLNGLFGAQRKLYKRVAQYSLVRQPSLFRALARRPYPWLVECARRFAAAAGKSLSEPIADHEILIDAPPVKLEVQFQIDVHFPKEGVYRPLGSISPVVQALAQRQFDDYVKRVRLFAAPRVADALRTSTVVDDLLRGIVSSDSSP